MEERRHEKIGSYSGGMKQRMGIAQILLHLPRILVVDEPTAGLIQESVSGSETFWLNSAVKG